MGTTPHYLVMTVGTAGDMHPFIRIAHTLQALGRPVTFVANTYHAGLVKQAGLPFIGLGTDEDFLRLLKNPDTWDPHKGFATMLANYREQLEDMLAAIRALPGSAPKVVIAHPFAVPAAAIARELGLVQSAVVAYLAPSNMRSCHDPFTLGNLSVPHWVPMGWRRALWRFTERQWIDPIGVAQINATREPLGLPKVHSLLGHLGEAPDLSLTLFPAWFASTAPDWPKPMITGGFPLPEASADAGFSQELTAFLAAGDKPLVFTPGTGNFNAGKFFKSALAAIQRLGRRAIFLTKERAQVPANLPDAILWQAYVPLPALLRHASALIHHGGIGTTSEALRSGTPQLVTPFGWDQFDNGARIASLGVGQVIHASRLRPRAMARSLHQLTTSDTVRARCAEVASRLTQPHDIAALCRDMERQLTNDGKLA